MRFYFLALLLLSSCSAQGDRFIEANNGDIVLYRPDSIFKIIMPYNIDVNGKPVCKLSNAGYIVFHEKSNVEVTVFSEPGTSRITLEPDPKRVTYVRLDLDGGKQGAGMAGGMIGMALAEGVSDHGGQFRFARVDESNARSELKNLRRDCT